MSLRQTLRKAAGLLVELPADESPAPPVEYGPNRGQAVDEVERIYAAMEVAPAPAKTVEQHKKGFDGWLKGFK